MNGAWCAGSDCIGDRGADGTWEVPAPFSAVLRATGLICLGLTRRESAP